MNHEAGTSFVHNSVGCLSSSISVEPFSNEEPLAMTLSVRKRYTETSYVEKGWYTQYTHIHTSQQGFPLSTFQQYVDSANPLLCVWWQSNTEYHSHLTYNNIAHTTNRHSTWESERIDLLHSHKERTSLTKVRLVLETDSEWAPWLQALNFGVLISSSSLKADQSTNQLKKRRWMYEEK